MKNYLYNPMAEYSLFIKDKAAREILVVGVLQDGIIYTGVKAQEIFLLGQFDDVISKERATLMHCLDLGATWQRLFEVKPCLLLKHKDNK